MAGRSPLDLLEIFGLNCLITKATGKTKTSGTLLDLILTSNKKKTLTSDVVDTLISDHSLVFTILPSTAPGSRSRKICLRSLKNFNRDKFIQDLQMAPFSIVDVFDEVDDKLYAFEELYSEILNEHAPHKQTVVRGNQVPYMTEQWRKAIRHRNKLWRLFMRDQTDANYNQYKIQRNICTSLRRKAMKNHFVKKSSGLVTVLPVLNNIYERLLATQLSEFYSTILTDFISSYRKFYSCETALLRLTEDWRRVHDRGELVAVVSMDLSKVFDVIQHDLLIAKLKHMESVKEVVRYLKTTCQEDSSE